MRGGGSGSPQGPRGRRREEGVQTMRGERTGDHTPRLVTPEGVGGFSVQTLALGLLLSEALKTELEVLELNAAAKR